MDDKNIIRRAIKLLAEREDIAYKNLISSLNEDDREKTDYYSKQVQFYKNAVDALSSLDCMNDNQ